MTVLPQKIHVVTSHIIFSIFPLSKGFPQFMQKFPKGLSLSQFLQRTRQTFLAIRIYHTTPFFSSAALSLAMVSAAIFIFSSSALTISATASPVP